MSEAVGNAVTGSEASADAVQDLPASAGEPARQVLESAEANAPAHQQGAANEAAAQPPGVSSPPPASQPAREEIDPRQRLHELANQLVRTRSRQLLLEYLRLRRTLR